MKVVAQISFRTISTLCIVPTKNCLTKIVEVFATGSVASSMHEFFTDIVFSAKLIVVSLLVLLLFHQGFYFFGVVNFSHYNYLRTQIQVEERKIFVGFSEIFFVDLSSVHFFIEPLQLFKLFL